MSYIFELLKNRTGFARIGRVLKTRNKEKIYNYTPDIAVHLNDLLLHNFHFLREFNDPHFFIISHEKHLNSCLLGEKFEEQYCIYTHYGKLERFQKVLEKKSAFLVEKDILCVIPFNIPTRAPSKEFASQAIKNYTQRVKKIINTYPLLSFGITIKLFGFSDLKEHYISLIQTEQRIKLVRIEDLFNKLRKFRSVIASIVTLKNKVDNNIIFLANGRILPEFYPLLIYLGIDLFDTSYLSYISSKNKYLTTETAYYFDQLEYLPCACRICRDYLINIKEGKIEKKNKILFLYLHNLIFTKFHIQKIKQKLKKEDFRNYLEKTTFHNLNAISLLKILDKDYSGRIEKETPISQKNKVLKCIGPSSYHRPDFEYYRKNTIKRFEPEPYTKIILLFPCSAKKPYSKSKSHRRFLRVLRKFENRYAFQEIILTSPLGAIPRQYENLYPVAFYDISVTGDWDHEEIQIAANMLINLLEKYDAQIPIIGHVEGEYKRIIKKAEQKLERDIEYTPIKKRSTTQASLNSLEVSIKKSLQRYQPPLKRPTQSYLLNEWNRKILKILDYQFGKGTGKKFYQEAVQVRINQRHRQIHLTDPSTHQELGIFKRSTGQFKISIEGAKRLKPLEDLQNLIIFNGDNLRGNTLFKPGILDYDKNLQPNEIVIISNETKEKIVGVGKMIVGSNYIKNTQSGRVVKLYETVD
ncbi:MAG: DUF5591 domain-containing protein [Promethearchaeia archaeon]